MSDGANWLPFEITPSGLGMGPGLDSLCGISVIPK
jgi:hypothetical protein